MVYDSVTAAALAGLVISDKTKPGITREYVDLSEKSEEINIEDKKVVAEIKPISKKKTEDS